MRLVENIFREYDIRGVVERDFDVEFAQQLGRAFAALVHEERGTTPKSHTDYRIAIGRDCRVSSGPLSRALADGLLEGGVNVVDCGMGPSPQLYFSVYYKNLDGGIQVTGSHNPADQNGFKMMLGQQSLSGHDIQRLREKIIELQKSSYTPTLGMSMAHFGAQQVYIDELVAKSSDYMGPKKLRIVTDAGNGVGGLVGPAMLRGLGCEVIELYSEPDGTFPNHHPDPSVLENLKELQERVVAEKADLGIAWDGDADRIGVVDEKGEVVFGDMLLLIFGRDILKELANPTILADVKCSDRLFSLLEEEGAKAVMCKTGHSLIKRQLKEMDAALGGELSGHVFFGHRYYGFDDALHGAARLAEIVSKSEFPLSGLLDDVPKVACTPEIRVPCAEEDKFLVVEKAIGTFSEFDCSTIDGVRITFPQGWALVRASNTLPILILRFEAETEELLVEYKSLVEERVHAIIKEVAAS